MDQKTLLETVGDYVWACSYGTLVLSYRLIKLVTIAVVGYFAWLLTGPIAEIIARGTYDTLYAWLWERGTDTWASWGQSWAGFLAVQIPMGERISHYAMQYGNIVLTPIIVGVVYLFFDRLEARWVPSAAPAPTLPSSPKLLLEDSGAENSPSSSPRQIQQPDPSSELTEAIEENHQRRLSSPVLLSSSSKLCLDLSSANPPRNQRSSWGGPKDAEWMRRRGKEFAREFQNGQEKHKAKAKEEEQKKTEQALETAARCRDDSIQRSYMRTNGITDKMLQEFLAIQSGAQKRNLFLN